MKSDSNYRKYLYSSIAIIFILLNEASAAIEVYTMPPGLKTSSDFTVKANEKRVWVEKIGSKLPPLNMSFTEREKWRTLMLPASDVQER